MALSKNIMPKFRAQAVGYTSPQVPRAMICICVLLGCSSTAAVPSLHPFTDIRVTIRKWVSRHVRHVIKHNLMPAVCVCSYRSFLWHLSSGLRS